MGYHRLYAYIWKGPAGRVRVSDERRPGYWTRVDRVYRLTTRDGVEALCRRDRTTGKWWWPVDGSAPIRNKVVIRCEDVTREAYELAQVL